SRAGEAGFSVLAADVLAAIHETECRDQARREYLASEIVVAKDIVADIDRESRGASGIVNGHRRQGAVQCVDEPVILEEIVAKRNVIDAPVLRGRIIEVPELLARGHGIVRNQRVLPAGCEPAADTTLAGIGNVVVADGDRVRPVAESFDAAIPDVAN